MHQCRHGCFRRACLHCRPPHTSRSCQDPQFVLIAAQAVQHCSARRHGRACFLLSASVADCRQASRQLNTLSWRSQMHSFASMHCHQNDTHSEGQAAPQEDIERSDGWQRCLDSCITQLCRGLAPHQTGLMPDFAMYDHTGQCYKPVLRQVLERPEDGCYGWNACR